MMQPWCCCCCCVMNWLTALWKVFLNQSDYLCRTLCAASKALFPHNAIKITSQGAVLFDICNVDYPRSYSRLWFISSCEKSRFWPSLKCSGCHVAPVWLWLCFSQQEQWFSPLWRSGCRTLFCCWSTPLVNPPSSLAIASRWTRIARYVLYYICHSISSSSLHEDFKSQLFLSYPQVSNVNGSPINTTIRTTTTGAFINPLLP